MTVVGGTIAGDRGRKWRFADDVGDAVRVERQRELVFALFDEWKGIRSSTQLAGFADQLGDTIVLSDTLGITDAVAPRGPAGMGSHSRSGQPWSENPRVKLIRVAPEMPSMNR